MRTHGLVPVVLAAAIVFTAPPAGSQDHTPAGPPLPERITVAQAIVLGMVEGLTEYLPISSTGHLILAGQAMGHGTFEDTGGWLGVRSVQSPAARAFEIVIQLGAVLAVIGLYRRRVLQMCAGVAGRDKEGRKLVLMLLLALAPAALAGPVLHKTISENLFSPGTVAVALAVGGVMMMVVEIVWRKKKPARITSIEDMTYRHALVIGLAQCLAMWPGVSRSMITIVAALIIGLDMMTAAEFSFLLALPTLGGATVYEAINSWGTLRDTAGIGSIAAGLLVSGVVAALAMAGFIRWLTKHGLWPFGIYRILLAAVITVWGHTSN